MISDASAVHPQRIAEHIETASISSCSRLLSFRPHTLGSSILNDPIFAQSNQSSLSPAAFASLDDGVLVTRAAAEDVLAERRRWLQVRSAFCFMPCHVVNSASEFARGSLVDVIPSGSVVTGRDYSFAACVRTRRGKLLCGTGSPEQHLFFTMCFADACARCPKCCVAKGV